MSRIIKILKSHSIKQIFIKIKKRFILKFKYIYYKYVISRIYDKVYRYDMDSFDTNMKFYYSIDNKQNIIRYYNENIIKKNQIIKDSINILEHKIDVLGSGIINLGKDINWSKDYKSNYTWENKFYKDIKIIDFSNDSDVKFPWEISRFNHLFTLGKAYWITDDIKFYEEFKNQIISWNLKNPYNMSVNWTCTMEVSIRAINWIFSYFHFENLIKEDKEFKFKLNNLLYIHGKYIYNNLENYDVLRNNHYISNLVGLLYIGIYFKDDNKKEIKKWIKLAKNELENEMKNQINFDGTSYESSTNYQRVVAELFLHAYMIGNINGINFTDEYKKKLSKMYKFLKDITKPNGYTPLIGDIDNGRLLIISDYYKWDKRLYGQLIDVASYYLEDNELYHNSNLYEEDELWLTNNVREKSNKKPSERNIAYEDGGFYILSNEKIWLIIRCGELSMRGQGGHSHNDQLSFELNINGKDIIIDPGSCTYTSSKELRNIDRSTINHNTLAIVGIEQNTFYDDIFEMREETYSEKLIFKENIFSGKHHGYVKKLNSIHKRDFILEKESISIIDNLENVDEDNTYYQVFNLDPSININILDNKLVLYIENINIYTNIDIASCTIEDTYIYRGYGYKIKTKKILVNFKNNKKISFSLNQI